MSKDLQETKGLKAKEDPKQVESDFQSELIIRRGFCSEIKRGG